MSLSSSIVSIQDSRIVTSLIVALLALLLLGRACRFLTDPATHKPWEMVATGLKRLGALWVRLMTFRHPPSNKPQSRMGRGLRIVAALFSLASGVFLGIIAIFLLALSYFGEGGFFALLLGAALFFLYLSAARMMFVLGLDELR